MPEDTTTTTTTETKPWFDGFEPELKDIITKKAWDKLDPSTLAKTALTSYHTAEKLIGVPASEVLRLPKPEDTTAWEEVFTRLGAPKEKSEYKIGEMKFSDGDTLSPEFVTYIEDAVHNARLRPDQASKVTTAFMQFLEHSEKASSDAELLTASQEMDKLKANWGANFDINDRIATSAANKLGITADNLTALKKTVGVSGTMEMLLNLGKAMGEARFITGEKEENNGVLSADQAQTRKEALMADTNWRARWFAGDAAAHKEMNDLNYRIVKARHG